MSFFDQATGRLISSSRMPLERLPESFAVNSQLKMAGVDYVVVSADPPTKPEFRATKQLKVMLRPRAN